MGSHRQTLLHDLTTFGALLAGETWVHSNNLMSGTCSLGFKDSEELTPRGIHDGFRHMMVLHHVRDLKVFYRNTMIAFSIGFRRLEMMVTALTSDFQMGLGRITSSLVASVRPLLPSAQHTLFASKRLLRGAIEARVLNRIALAIGQEGRESHVLLDR